MRKLYLEMAQIIIGSFLFDKQWGYIENNISYIFPISFSENAYVANATHFGTNNNTPVIVRALDKNHVEIGVGSTSASCAYVLICGK